MLSAVTPLNLNVDCSFFHDLLIQKNRLNEDQLVADFLRKRYYSILRNSSCSSSNQHYGRLKLLAPIGNRDSEDETIDSNSHQPQYERAKIAMSECDQLII